MEENPVNDDVEVSRECRFSPSDVIAVVRTLVKDAGDLQIVRQVFTPEGVLFSLDVRAPGSAMSYTYELTSTGVVSPMIYRVDYAGPDSETVIYSEVLADYKNGAWVKQ